MIMAFGIAGGGRTNPKTPGPPGLPPGRRVDHRPVTARIWPTHPAVAPAARRSSDQPRGRAAKGAHTAGREESAPWLMAARPPAGSPPSLSAQAPPATTIKGWPTGGSSPPGGTSVGRPAPRDLSLPCHSRGLGPGRCAAPRALPGDLDDRRILLRRAGKGTPVFPPHAGYLRITASSVGTRRLCWRDFGGWLGGQCIRSGRGLLSGPGIDEPVQAGGGDAAHQWGHDE